MQNAKWEMQNDSVTMRLLHKWHTLTAKPFVIGNWILEI